MPLFLAGLAVVSFLAFVLFMFFKLFYVVVEPNKAHVVVSMGGGRKIYHPAQESSSSAYFYIPFLMRRIIVSLENVKHEIKREDDRPGVELRDKNLAPFVVKITCWFKIEKPELAAEKLDVDSDGNIMDSIRSTLDAQVQGVVRAVAMKQEIIELMRDRKTFGENVYNEVNGDLDDWGIKLVKLEIIDFSDTENSHVIQDYEARRESEISSETRKIVAVKEKDAKVTEAEAKKIAEKARLDSEQEIEMREIEKEEKVGIRNESARLQVAKQQEQANQQEVQAEKTKTVGKAQYEAEATEIKADGIARAEVKTANGKAQGVKLEAEAAAEARIKTGKAEADVIQAKGAAEATALEKKADAQKKFTDVSKDIEMAKIAADIQKTMYNAMAQALAKANLNIVSPDMKFMGFGAEEGAGLGALAKALETTSGTNLTQLVQAVADRVQSKKPITE